MSNPILALVEKYAGPGFVPRFKEQAAAVIEDFWKNPACEFPVIEFKLAGRIFRLPNLLKPMPLGSGVRVSAAPAPATVKPPAPPAPSGLPWHAEAGQVSEKMWGEGNILPVGDAIADMLVNPLGLTKEKNLLDLSAGLGGPLRKLSGRINQLKGFETDAAIAARGMEMLIKTGNAKQISIAVYNPADFSQPATADAVIARELFYRIADKPKFFYSIAACLKPQGQVAFTDYIVDPENRDKPAITSWQQYEKGSQPLGIIEMAEAWAKAGLELRVSEDQTLFYKREIVAGLKRLVQYLGSGVHPDAETKKLILSEVETWIRRTAAIEQGMKFYRFHAIKS